MAFIPEEWNSKPWWHNICKEILQANLLQTQPEIQSSSNFLGDLHEKRQEGRIQS